MVISVASGGKFYRLPPDKENTENSPLILPNRTNTKSTGEMNKNRQIIDQNLKARK